MNNVPRVVPNVEAIKVQMEHCGLTTPAELARAAGLDHVTAGSLLRARTIYRATLDRVALALAAEPGELITSTVATRGNVRVDVEVLRRELQYRGWSPRKLARAARRGPAAVWRAMQGRPVREATAASWARALGIEPEELLAA